MAEELHPLECSWKKPLAKGAGILSWTFTTLVGNPLQPEDSLALRFEISLSVSLFDISCHFYFYLLREGPMKQENF